MQISLSLSLCVRIIYKMAQMLVLVLIFMIVVSSEAQLKVGYYADVCPNAESIVGGFVRDAAISNHNMAAVMLRLHFHDCFVEGCDGSILVDNGNRSESNAFGHIGVRGFDLIENAKAMLETVCPGVVSCADIVAMAARDAVFVSNGPIYQVETGRRDGLVSDVALAANMPDVKDSIELLKAKFFEKGLTEKDLVVLSAAHTIGKTACFFMGSRLYDFVPGGGPDPTISPSFLSELTATCPRNGDPSVRFPIDLGSGEMFDKHIMSNIRSGFAVLQSDAALYQDPVTGSVVDSYFDPFLGLSFETDFAIAMVKMGRIGVKTGPEGTIRRVCSSFN